MLRPRASELRSLQNLATAAEGFAAVAVLVFFVRRESSAKDLSELREIEDGVVAEAAGAAWALQNCRRRLCAETTANRSAAFRERDDADEICRSLRRRFCRAGLPGTLHCVGRSSRSGPA